MTNEKDKYKYIFSVVGSIKSSFIGTNRERAEMKAAAEGLKALGNLAKSK